MGWSIVQGLWFGLRGGGEVGAAAARRLARLVGVRVRVGARVGVRGRGKVRVRVRVRVR